MRFTLLVPRDDLSPMENTPEPAEAASLEEANAPAASVKRRSPRTSPIEAPSSRVQHL